MKFREELEDGEEVFSRRASLIFKHVQVVRFFDKTRNALVYLTYSDKVIEGSPKNSISAVVIRDWQAPAAPLYRAARAGDAGRRRAGGRRPARARRWRSRPRRWRRTAAAIVPCPTGTRFRAVIGDMDSLRDPERLRAAGVPMHPRSPSRTSTDLEKCLYSVEAPLFIGLGFLGGRIDHHLAAMNALVRHRRTGRWC